MQAQARVAVGEMLVNRLLNDEDIPWLREQQGQVAEVAVEGVAVVEEALFPQPLHSEEPEGAVEVVVVEAREAQLLPLLALQRLVDEEEREAEAGVGVEGMEEPNNLY